MAVRLTQAYTEVVYYLPPTVLVTQSYTETAYYPINNATVRMTQAYTEVAYSQSLVNTAVRVTQAYTEIAFLPQKNRRRGGFYY